MKKNLLIIFGFISLGLGLIGILIPILPTTPFLLLTLYLFAKSSKKLEAWFITTKIYDHYLKDYKERKGMTKTAKKHLMLTLSAIFFVAIYFMRNKIILAIIVGVIWLFHILYFAFRVKTIEK